MEPAIDRIMMTYDLLLNRTAAASADARAKVTEYLAKLIEAGENAQQGRLAAAAWPNDAQELAWRHAQIDVVERDQGGGAVAVNLVEMRDFDRRAAPLDTHTVSSSRGRS